MATNAGEVRSHPTRNESAVDAMRLFDQLPRRVRDRLNYEAPTEFAIVPVFFLYQQHGERHVHRCLDLTFREWRRTEG